MQMFIFGFAFIEKFFLDLFYVHEVILCVEILILLL